jgi:transposase
MNDQPLHEPVDAQKRRTGLSRMAHAFGYSVAGLRAGWGETAFRQEALAAMVLIAGGASHAQDATTLPAHSEYTVLQLVAEVGTDLTRWPTEKHFASWLCLAPGSAQSGKRRTTVKRRRNRAGQIFCVMARALARSKYIALGGYYRRMAARRGGLVANKALAHKLAILFWRVMVKGMDYVEKGLAHYEAQVLETRQRLLRKLAKQFGQQLVPIQANPP